MGTISIFSLDFSGTRFACRRNFTGGYTLQAGDNILPMEPNVAEALAGGGARIRLRAQVAAHYGREMKAGATFRRDMLAVDGRVAHIEIGVSDVGDSVFLEIGTARMTLADQQAQLLLAVLDQLGRDVSALYRATAGPEDNMAWGIAPGLHGPGLGLPDWADDTKWR
jgi:hypothetical protein